MTHINEVMTGHKTLRHAYQKTCL